MMNERARTDGAHERDGFPLADDKAVVDNDCMSGDTTKPLHQPLVRQAEYWIISLGMSVIAYLLERVILRSIKNGEAKP
ncbi:MAG: hypothetical protein H8K03_09695 [Nitrospira sp.]|jgi:hypothetical protein|nr:hypothetical protein [Nitrospira sp. BO4]